MYIDIGRQTENYNTTDIMMIQRLYPKKKMFISLSDEWLEKKID